MSQHRINDNSKTKSGDFNCIKNLVGKIENKTLEQLKKEGVFVFPDVLEDVEDQERSQDLTKNQMILQKVNESYQTGNVMGFIGCGNERLVISSRFSRDDKDYFFHYMLEKVLDVPNIFDLETDSNEDNRLFSFLIFLFPKYLKDAMRKGLYKKYILHQYNDGNVKGTIDIARHIKRNIPFVGKIAYNQREFSYDNHLMQLVRHTIEFIKRNKNGNQLLSRVKDEVSLVVQATQSYEFYDRQKIIDTNKKNRVQHAYYHEYQALQRLCLMILQHKKHQVGIGSQQIYGILFDGAWLWEEYINTLIEKDFHHPMNKGGKGAQWLFESSGKKIGLIYPDFIGKDPSNRVIADAKYKPIENIGNRDYFQVLAYMYRFDAKKGYYLYPEADGQEPVKLKLNSGNTFDSEVKARDDVFVIKLGLKIPSCEGLYNDFIESIVGYENEFKNKICIV